MRGWEGRVCFTWFHLVCKFPCMFCLARALACVWVLLVLLSCWVGCWFLSLGKFDLNHRLIPVVDRPCLALVRQCRKKNPFQRLGCMQDNIYLYWATWAIFTCGNRYVLVKRYWVLRGFHRSESVVFHLVFWMSSFFSCWVGALCFGACFCCTIWRHPAFYISPVVDRPQDVLMSVRTSTP